MPLAAFLWAVWCAPRRGGAALAARQPARPAALLAQRPRFCSRARRLHLDHNLLPGGAPRETVGDPAAALAQWDARMGAPELTEHFCRLDDLAARDFCWTHAPAGDGAAP
jgi:hypothetical protein